MEERDNKTIMCGVLFLDIVEYSKKSVSGQISLKERFNSYLSAAISEVPIADRIILDTGDGAAINFIGDVKDALNTALSLRESLLNEEINVDPPLLVRMGVNLGPVRLVRDINGQPSIVGDGINVAQRVMGFADAAQILVSRSYYDAVSRLSPQYAGMFHYQGSRTDKHVREHEVYAIGYPGDTTTQRNRIQSVVAERVEDSLLGRAKTTWRFAASKLDVLLEHPVNTFRQAGPKQRVLYAGVVAAPLVIIIVLFANLAHRDKISPEPASMGGQAANTLQPASSVVPISSVVPVSPASDTKARTAISVPPKAAPKPKKQKVIEEKKPISDAEKKAIETSSNGSAGATISISCMGAEVFVDGTRKGRITSSPWILEVSPGKHAVIVSHAKGFRSQDIVFNAGKSVHLKPSFCNQ